MLGILILVGSLASVLLAGRAIEMLRDRRNAEEALIAIPVEISELRRRH